MALTAPMHRTCRGYALSILIGAAALAPFVAQPAVALAEPTAISTETARALVNDGRAKLDAKDYAGAHRALRAAHDILGTPASALDLAKAQEGLGLLIEARATALGVASIAPKPPEPEAFADARAASAALADKLTARIPSVVISVTGMAPTITPRVIVDGVTLSSSLLAQPRQVNPGAHTILTAAPGYTLVRRSVTVQEGETVPVEIALTETATLAPAATAGPLSSTLAPQGSNATPRGLSEQRGVGVALSFIGLISLGVGTAFGGLAIVRNNDSKLPVNVSQDAPPGQPLPPPRFDPPPCDAQNFCDANGKALRYEAFRAATISTIGFLAGGALVTGGVILIATSPPSRRVSPRFSLGPGGISVTGSW